MIMVFVMAYVSSAAGVAFFLPCRKLFIGSLQAMEVTVTVE